MWEGAIAHFFEMAQKIPQVPDDHMVKHAQTWQLLARQMPFPIFSIVLNFWAIICEGQMIFENQKPHPTSVHFNSAPGWDIT